MTSPRLTFATIFISGCLLLLCSAAGCSTQPPAASTAPVAADWKTIVNANTLENRPTVSSESARDEPTVVTVTNDGTTTLIYCAAGQHVQLFQECEEAGEWKLNAWDWCGTGKQDYELVPGKSVQLHVTFWDKHKRERMLAYFAEKGADRGGLVVLAVEP